MKEWFKKIWLYIQKIWHKLKVWILPITVIAVVVLITIIKRYFMSDKDFQKVIDVLEKESKEKIKEAEKNIIETDKKLEDIKKSQEELKKKKEERNEKEKKFFI